MYRETGQGEKDTSGNWRNRAACLMVDPELFFPTGTSGPALDQINKAKEVCGRCAVKAECLSYALETNQNDGVWGGLSEDERRAMKRRATARRRVARSALNTY